MYYSIPIEWPWKTIIPISDINDFEIWIYNIYDFEIQIRDNGNFDIQIQYFRQEISIHSPPEILICDMTKFENSICDIGLGSNFSV